MSSDINDKDLNKDLEESLEEETREIQTVEPPKRFDWYGFLVFALISVIIWIVGQFSPGFPDELGIWLLSAFVYLRWGVKIPGLKK